MYNGKYGIKEIAIYLGLAVNLFAIGKAVYGAFNGVEWREIFDEAWVFPLLITNAILFALVILNRVHLKKAKSSVFEYEEKWQELQDHAGLCDHIMKLKESKYHPSQLLSQVQKSWDFQGHGASKWFLQNEEKVREAIVRVKLKGGLVRILVFNPIMQTRDMDEQQKILKSLLVMRRLKEEVNTTRETLQVRLYDHQPTFRMAFWNKDYVLVGHYQMYQGNSNESPMLVFNSENEWGFYSVFADQFVQEWDHGVPFEEHWDELKKLYKKNNIAI